jgi:hypothetical protein
MIVHNLQLDMLHSHFEAEWALKAWEKGDGALFGSASYPNSSSLHLVAANWLLLRSRGMYEAAMLEAYTGCKIDNRRYSLSSIKWLFDLGDRERFRALGSPVPSTLTVYRGVYRHGRERQIRSFSWTTSLDVACWYALRGLCGEPDPAIYRATVTARSVICYFDGRKEKEVIVQPRKVERVEITLEEMTIGEKRFSQLLRDRQVTGDAAVVAGTPLQARDACTSQEPSI